MTLTFILTFHICYLNLGYTVGEKKKDLVYVESVKTGLQDKPCTRVYRTKT